MDQQLWWHEGEPEPGTLAYEQSVLDETITIFWEDVVQWPDSNKDPLLNKEYRWQELDWLVWHCLGEIPKFLLEPGAATSIIYWTHVNQLGSFPRCACGRALRTEDEMWAVDGEPGCLQCFLVENPEHDKR